MKWPWQKRNQRASKDEPPVVRPPSDRPITELEVKRLEERGQWLHIEIQVMPNGTWVNWRHDIPEELRDEARDALVALALELQGGK